MNEAKHVLRGLVLCFLAISEARVLKAFICGSACTFAASYVIAPCNSHILILFNSITAGLIIVYSLCSDIKACRFILQGFCKIRDVLFFFSDIYKIASETKIIPVKINLKLKNVNSYKEGVGSV